MDKNEDIKADPNAPKLQFMDIFGFILRKG